MRISRIDALEAATWRRETMAYYLRTATAMRSWSRKGLQEWVMDAQRAFEAATGLTCLPWNLSIHGPYVGDAWETRHHDRFEVVEASARFAGWIRTVPSREDGPSGGCYIIAVG